MDNRSNNRHNNQIKRYPDEIKSIQHGRQQNDRPRTRSGSPSSRELQVRWGAVVSGSSKDRERPRRSVNVDVAKERKNSGYVDVMTGKRLDGRVDVPVDRRRRRPSGDAGRVAFDDAVVGNADRRRTPAADGKRNAQNEKSGKNNRPDQGRKKKGSKKQSKGKKPTKQELMRQKRLKEEKARIRKERLERAKRISKVVLKVFAVLVVVALIAFVYLYNCYKLKKITVSGTDHYTNEQMIDIVSGGKKQTNTLLFLLNNRLNPVGEVTFIDKIDVKYVDRNTISITVYEKAMAGCIEHGSEYAYFDGDGIVLELSSEKLSDVPCIYGISGDNVSQGEKLSVGDEDLFRNILMMTQLISKNNITVDKITYNKDNKIILHKDGIKIIIGEGENLESKFMNLDNILSKLAGKKGTLDMSNYTSSNGSAIFRENK